MDKPTDRLMTTTASIPELGGAPAWNERLIDIKELRRMVGYENLTKPYIADAIAAAQQERSERTAITADRVLQELARIGFSNLRNVLTDTGHLTMPSDWDEDTAAAIASIEVVTRPAGGFDKEGRRIVEHIHKIRSWDKVSALEKMGKHLGMFTDRVEHTGRGGKPIELDVMSQMETARRIAFALRSVERDLLD